MTAAASAWSGLSAELKSAAGAYRSIINQLTSEEWLGPASASLVAAVNPYVRWMDLTGEQAEQAASQARAAAAAYETAHALTVPPTAVTTNRVQLQQLVATNILGQNTAAIAETEVQHHEMWAQDAIAMQGYHAQSTAASTLNEFTPPPNPTNPAGELAQAGAVGQASANAAGTQATKASGTMQGLVNSLSAQPAEGTVPATTGAEQFLNDPNVMLGEKGLDQAISTTNLGANNICAVWRGLSGITGAQKLMGDLAKDAAKAAEGAAKGAAGAAQGAAGAASGLGGVAGSMGQAGALGALSVPPSWAPPTPPVSALGPVSGGSWQPVGPGILGSAPMAPPAGMPGVLGAPGAAGAAGAGFRGFGSPRYGSAITVMPRMPVGG